MKLRSDKSVFIALAAALALAGCAGETIEVYSVPKEKQEAPAARADFAMAPAPPAAQQGNLHWTAPKGWQEEPASGMRLASFAVSGQGGSKADMSVVVLPGPAGGLLANINRWRGQLGLEPWSESDLAKGAQRVKSKAGEVTVVDLKNQGNQMLAALLFDGEQSWFFKMNGSQSVVTGARPAYLEFLRSLHFADHH